MRPQVSPRIDWAASDLPKGAGRRPKARAADLALTASHDLGVRDLRSASASPVEA